jgi:hypothetical protein
MKKTLFRHFGIILLMIALVSCGIPPAATSDPTQEIVEPTATENSSSLEPTPTLDPCSRPQLEEEAQEVHKHMREFDDASILASNMPRDQLGNAIADLQRIRRESEDEEIPACLTGLKSIQVQHMNTVISTLIAFMRVTDPRAVDCVEIEPNTEEAAICQSIAIARQQHDQYILELAKMLGLTAVAATMPPPPSETPAP